MIPREFTYLGDECLVSDARVASDDGVSTDDCGAGHIHSCVTIHVVAGHAVGGLDEQVAVWNHREGPPADDVPCDGGQGVQIAHTSRVTRLHDVLQEGGGREVGKYKSVRRNR